MPTADRTSSRNTQPRPDIVMGWTMASASGVLFRVVANFLVYAPTLAGRTEFTQVRLQITAYR